MYLPYWHTRSRDSATAAWPMVEGYRWVYIIGLLDVSVWPEGLVAVHKVESSMRGLRTASNVWSVPLPTPGRARKRKGEEAKTNGH